jgi:thiamine-phosphate diphosphorylase
VKPKLPAGIYGITSGDFGFGQEQSALYLLKAGLKIIQYREKDASTKTMYDEAMRIQRLCRQYGALFIVNDRIDIALAVDADGVHVGQDDMPLEIVKKIYGNKSGKIIGVSVRSEPEVIAAQGLEADYLGAGAVYPTSTKQDSTHIGLDMLASIMRASTVPVYAIGGIAQRHLKELKSYGVYGAAVISAILNTHDPEKTAREFIDTWGTNEK